MSGLAPASRIVGRYAIFEPIASGGMATVHLGKLIGEAGFSRTVAIKRLHENFIKNAQFVAMMVDEARLASRIRHPNVVPTLDVVSLDGELLVVMEYVHGAALSSLSSLSDDSDDMRPIPVGIAVAILLDTLHGLHAAHEAKDQRNRPLGIVHRDVSPQNILVGADGVSRVLDFGVAKAAGRVQSTTTGQIKGKLAYMAPEQMIASEVDRRVDIYAAGVVLWEALAGRRLFDGDTDAQIMYKVLNAKVERPSAVAAPGSGGAIPPALDDIVMTAVDRSPDARFATAHDFAVALEAAAPDIPRAREVGAWVDEHAKPSLDQRLAQITAIERSPSTPPSSGEAALSNAAASSTLAPDAVADAAPAHTRAGLAPTMSSARSPASPALGPAATMPSQPDVGLALGATLQPSSPDLGRVTAPMAAPSPSYSDLEGAHAGGPVTALGAVSTVDVPSTSPARGWIVGLGVAFVALALAGTTAGVLGVRARRTQNVDPAAGTATTAPTAAAASDDSTEPPAPAVPASASASSVPEVTSTASAPATIARPGATNSSSRVAAPRASADACDPPWTIDSSGVRVPKRACFKK